MSRFVRVGVPLVLGGILAGCLALQGGGAVGPEPGKLAPPVEGGDAEGRRVSLADYKGRVVLLHFWHSA
jgi:hypothetical protein